MYLALGRKYVALVVSALFGATSEAADRLRCIRFGGASPKLTNASPMPGTFFSRTSTFWGEVVFSESGNAIDLADCLLLPEIV